MRISLFSIILMMFMMNACSIKKPGGEVPAPHVTGIEKSFFKASSSNKMQVGGLDGKVFIGAWAPVTEMGKFGESWEVDNAAINYHANIVFKVEEYKLLGLLVNPSFPNDSAKWETVITIPIVKHYYYEKSKDQYGRETSNYIENSSRSHWSVRSMMKLNFSGTTIHKWAYALQDGEGVRTLAAEDVEWDNDNEFFAFTLTVSNGFWGSDLQTKYRFNFKAIDPAGSPGFKKTHYHPDNARYINILHLIGRKQDAVNPKYLAAHWDFQKPIDFYLNDFPERFQDIARDVVELWNDELQKLGFNRPLQAKFVQNPRYYFDLRKPSMTWMGDKRISRNSPLGIGQAQANVFNGEIVWGGVMIWGGILEDYIKQNAPLGIGESVDGFGSALSQASSQLYYLGDKNLTSGVMDVASKKIGAYSNDSLAKLTERLESILVKNKRGMPGESAQNIAALADSMNRMYQDSITKQMRGSYRFEEMLPLAPEAYVRNYFHLPERYPLDLEHLSAETTKNLFLNKDYISGVSQSGFDYDVTFNVISSQLSHAVAKMKKEKKTFSIQQALRVFLKDLMTHEMGHLLGLGHNFKENILPPKGSVPDKYYEELKTAAENGMKNYSSVMGYRNPFTVLDSSYDEIKVGPHDSLVMRYLYKQEFATYEDGDEDFTFVKLADDGRIDESLNVSYFPACNDLDASYHRDPYCNRHARGHDAKTIMTSHFESIDYFIDKIQAAFTDHRNIHDPKTLEGYLFSRAIRELSRIRHFYDYMRLKYKDQFNEIGKKEADLLYFSQACSSEEQGRYERLDRIFDENPELKELCQANKMAVDRMAAYLTLGGGDYSSIDRSTKLSPGSLAVGDAAPGLDQMFGSWKSISPFYLKWATLYTLTSNYAYMQLGPFIIPNWEYTILADGAYNYFSLYPFELTEMVANGVISNMQLLNDKNDKAEVSRLSFYTGLMLNQAQNGTNDQGTFIARADYFDKIFRQNQFQANFYFVILEPNYIGSSYERIHSFRAIQYQNFGNTDLGNAFVLPNRRIIVDNPGKIIYPLMEPIFARGLTADGKSSTLIYTIALILDYTVENEDRFSGLSARSRLLEVYSEELQRCVHNGNNGLGDFFNAEMRPSVFEGFFLPPGIGGSNSKDEEAFYDSLDEGYTKYSEITGKKIDDCLNVFINLGAISSNAAMINSFFFGDVFKYLNKN